MLELKIAVTVRDGKQMEFFQTLDSLVKLYRKEEGCLSYEYEFDATNVNECRITATWETGAQLEQHFRGANFTVLLGAMQLLCSRQKVEIIDGDRVMGMEFVQAAREKS